MTRGGWGGGGRSSCEIIALVLLKSIQTDIQALEREQKQPEYIFLNAVMLAVDLSKI